MTSIDVHRHIRQIQLLKCILNAFIVRRLRIRTLGHVEVGDHVRQTVGLDNKQGADVAERGELHLDCVDVGLVVGDAVVGNAVLAIGGGGRAITVREIVDNEQTRVGRRRALGVGSADITERLGH